MRIGIICEGSTDDAVLRVILRDLCASKDLTFSTLQPAVDALGRVGLGGWQAVRKFLQQSAATLAATPLDMIVVQVDADIRSLPEIAKKLTPEDGDEALDPLCRHVKSWMSAGVPAQVVIVLPRESTESWLVAANTHRKDVESDSDPAQKLVDAGHLESAKGKESKVPSVYAALAAKLLPKLRKAAELRALPELERFVGKVHGRARHVQRSAKKGARE